jgi:glycosyltransferase involved in cell wall biosynthesis
MPNQQDVAAIRRSCGDRTLLAKIARWDPDKRWLLAIRIVEALKDAGARPLLVARGGSEQHGSEVFDEALRLGLRVANRSVASSTADGLAEALESASDADVINVTSPLDAAGTRCLLHAADVVLANSGREPFGLVGLETMAVGGVACTGCTGEDYAVPGKNAIVQQTNDPREFLGLFAQLRSDDHGAQALRDSGAATARDYAWPVILQRNLLPRALAMLGILATHVA